MNDAVELQEVDTFVEAKEQEKLNYPCAVIQGITTEEEVLYFNKKFSVIEKSVPLYILFNGVYKKIGTFELSLNNLLVIRSIAKYELQLMLAEDKCVSVDMDNPETLINFIKLVD